MGQYRARVPSGANSFTYDGNTYAGGAAFESDNPCAILGFYRSFKAANPGMGRSNGSPNFWRNMESRCAASGGTVPPPSTTAPPPATTPPPAETRPPTGGDSADIQGAPRVDGTVDGHDSRATRPGTGDDSPTADEPTRPPNGEPHPTRSGEPPGEPVEGGDPVDLFSGTMALRETDLEIANTVLPLGLSRVYRSGPGFLGAFGWNWDHNHNLFVRELNNGDIALWRSGHEEQFVHTGGGFEPPRGVFEKLGRVTGVPQAFELSGPGGSLLRFERPPGWTDVERIPIVWRQDRHGNRLSYRYGADDHLVKVEDEDGRFIELGYGDLGLLTTARDHTGRRYDYGYDPETRHLTCVARPSTTDHPDGTRRIYHYEPAFTPVSLRHNLLRIEDADGNVYLENRYEKDPASFQYGRITEQLYGGHLYQFCATQLQWVPPRAEYVNIHSVRVEVLDPDLSLQIYTFNFRGDLLDRRYRLLRDGSFRVVVEQYEYDAQGNRSRTVGADGSEEILTYDFASVDPRMRGRLLRKELTAATGFPSPSRIVWRGSYEPRYQLLTSETDEAGSTTSMRYDFDLTPAAPGNTGKLMEVEQPDATLPDGAIQHATTRFEYNTRGQPVAMDLPDGTRTEYGYGSTGHDKGRLISETRDVTGLAIVHRRSYDPFGNASESTDGNGAVTQRIHNPLGLVERLVRPAVAGALAEERYHYDAYDHVVSVERPKGAYEGGMPDASDTHLVDRFERDVLGYATRVVLSSNTSESRTFTFCNDHRGLARQTATPDDAVLKTTFDERRLPLAESVVGHDGLRVESEKVYDRSGRLVRERDVFGSETRYEYDGFGRVRIVSLPNGSERRFTWQGRDLLESEETVGDDGSGAVRLLERTEHAYDEKARRVRTTVKTFADDPTTAVDATTTFYYDTMDRVVRMVDARGAASTRDYDGLGRLVSETDAVGNEERYHLDANGNTLQQVSLHLEPDGGVTTFTRGFEYDARDRRTAVVEPDGARVTSVYDDRDLVTERVDRLGVATRSFYDAFNNRVRRVHDPGGLDITHRWKLDLMSRVTEYTDPEGQVTRYGYDSVGRRVHLQYPNGFQASLTFNERSQVVEETLGSGARFSYSYDAANRLQTVLNTSAPPPLQALAPHEFTYDGMDRLTRAVAGANEVRRSYDSRGRLLSEMTSGTTIACRYDDAAGEVEKTWPDGRTEVLTHDLNGVLSSISESASGGLGAGVGPLVSLRPSGPAAVGDAEFRGGTTIANEYDERRRVTAITAVSPAGLDEAVQYRYDSEGRRRVEALTGSAPKNSFFEFDAARRLRVVKERFAATIPPASTQSEHDAASASVQSAASGAAHEEGFSYNSADARLSHTRTGDPAKSYLYAPGHQIQSDGTSTYTHHDDGGRRSDGGFQYEVDAFGRIVSIAGPSGIVVALEYDALGRPSVLREAGQADRTLHYLGGFVEQEDVGGVPERQLTRHPVTGVPVAYHTSAGTHFALVDGRYNLLGLVDTSGQLVETFRYDAFGAPRVLDSGGSPIPASSVGVPPLFGGQRYLAGPGLYLAKHRLMDPRNGLFLSPDPKGYVDSPMLYAYAAQNPVDNIDPNGDVIPFIVAAFVIGGALAGAGYSFYDAYHNPSRYEGGSGTLRVLGNVFGGAAIGGVAVVAGEGVLAVGGTGIFASGGAATATSLTATQSFVLYGTSAATSGGVLRYGFNSMFPEYVDPVTPGTVAFDYVTGGGIGATIRVLSTAGAAGPPGSATSYAPRSWGRYWDDLGGEAAISGQLGPYPGRIGALLDRIGIRQGYSSTVTNFDAMAGGSWFARTDTAVHEGVHVLVARYFPTFRNLSHSTRLWAAAARYPEEVVAYAFGRAAALRPHGIPVAPLDAFSSLSMYTPAQQSFARWTWGTFWVGSISAGLGVGLAYAETPPNEKPPSSK